MCPFIDNADARCASHLTFRNVAHAFAHCADHFRACPIYQQLIARGPVHAKDNSAMQYLAAS